MIKKWFFFFACWLAATAAPAQILTPVKWEVRLTNAASAEQEIRFTATADPGWHVYDMNLPDGGPISTAIRYESKNGVELIGVPTASVAPIKVHDELFNMDLRWYAGKVTFTQKLKITDAKRFKLAGDLQFMACNDENCLPPEHIPFSFDRNDVRNVPPPSQTVADAPSQAVEPDTVAPVTEVEPAVAVAATTPSPSGGSAHVAAHSLPLASVDLWTPVIAELKASGDPTANALDAALWFIFWAGFAGGLIALLTPCVWPMLPLTVSFFLKRSGNRKKAVRDAIIYGLSIIVIYLLMGLLITAIFGAGALNDLSTNATFNVLFFLLLLAFAISFLGAFELTLPSAWTNRIDAKADTTSGVWSIFFMAFTLVLVSFSCTGPIIGTLLVEAASGSGMLGPTVGMAGFALALAIPFALFAVFPNLMKNLPRSGGWLQSVKITLGFLELALALKFLSVADLAYGWRILDREVFLVLWIVIFILLGFHILGKIRFKYDAKVRYLTVPRLFLAIVSLAFALYMIPGLWGAPLKAISAFAPPLYTQDFNLYKDEVRAVFDDYETGMAYAQKVDRPALIDFSGYGCVNCRKMEASVWTDPKVKALLDERFILISLMVDDKAKLPQPITVTENGKQRTLKTVGDKWSYLQRYKFGANAQPFYVILNGDGQPLSPSYAYNEEVAAYVRFLENGLKNYHK